MATMDTILGSRSESENTAATASTPIHALSAPEIPAKITDEVPIKVQASAPSYLFSLKDNEAPPFRTPGKEARPRLLINTIVNEEEVIGMIAAADSEPNGLKKCLGYFLVDKKITENFNLSEKNFLISLISEAIEYAAQRDFSAFKLSVFLTIYLDAHLYFKWYYWLPPIALWTYFKENMIRHTIEDAPASQEVFGPEECYDIVSHFHAVYISNLPLVHLVTFRAHRLRFTWPFKPK